MKQLLFLVFLIASLAVNAQQAGEVQSRSQAIEAIGDTAYYLLDTVRIYNDLGELDVSSSRTFLGDSTQAENKVSNTAFPYVGDVSSALTQAFGYHDAVRRVQTILPIIQTITGLNVFQYTGLKYGNNIMGSCLVRQEDGTVFEAEIVRQGNNTMRLVRTSDSAEWVIQMYSSNLFQLVDFDHDNDGGTAGGTYLMNFWRNVGDSGRRQFLPVESLTGETNLLTIVTQ